MIQFKASFDDGCKLDLRVADLLEKYGFQPEEVVFFIPSEWENVNHLHGDEPMTYDEVCGLAKRFKIGSHTVSHPMLTRIPHSQVDFEIKISKLELEEMFGTKIEDFCYPRGYANDVIRDEARKHYKRARNTLVGNLSPPEDPIWESTTVHVSGKRRKEYEDTTWVAEGRRLLKEAIRRDVYDEDVVFHLWGHSWEIERHDDWADFERFLELIASVR